MPSVPAKGALLKFWARKGYWVFFPRYRGTWESGGRFLRSSPEKDIRDVIAGMWRGFRDLGSGKRYAVKPEALYLFGSSFGGPAAILASRDPRVMKVVAISPIVDWTVPSRVERLDWLWKFIRSGFGEAFRFSKKDWDKLEKGKFYNPMGHTKEIEGRKLFIIHARDDRVVSAVPVRKFAKKVGATLFLLKKGGHLGSSVLMKPQIYKRVRKFLSQRI